MQWPGGAPPAWYQKDLTATWPPGRGSEGGEAAAQRPAEQRMVLSELATYLLTPNAPDLLEFKWDKSTLADGGADRAWTAIRCPPLPDDAAGPELVPFAGPTRIAYLKARAHALLTAEAAAMGFEVPAEVLELFGPTLTPVRVLPGRQRQRSHNDEWVAAGYCLFGSPSFHYTGVGIGKTGDVGFVRMGGPEGLMHIHSFVAPHYGVATPADGIADIRFALDCLVRKDATAAERKPVIDLARRVWEENVKDKKYTTYVSHGGEVHEEEMKGPSLGPAGELYFMPIRPLAADFGTPSYWYFFLTTAWERRDHSLSKILSAPDSTDVPSMLPPVPAVAIVAALEEYAPVSTSWTALLTEWADQLASARVLNNLRDQVAAGGRLLDLGNDLQPGVYAHDTTIDMILATLRIPLARKGIAVVVPRDNLNNNCFSNFKTSERDRIDGILLRTGWMESCLLELQFVDSVMARRVY